MATIENFSILTSLGRDGTRLILRLDTDGRGELGENGRAMILTLEGCSDPSTAEVQLREFVGKPIEYGSSSGSVWLSIDYGWEECDLECASLTETEVDLTLQDVLIRSRYLAELAKVYANRSYQTSAQLGILVEAISLEVTRGLDRARRKLGFFHETNPTREAATAAQIKVYERMETLLAERRPDTAA